MGRSFGEQLRHLREERNLSLRELAKVVNHSKSVLSKWESGGKIPAPDVAAALDRDLGAHGTLARLAEPDVHDKAKKDSERLAAQLLAVQSGEMVDVAESNTIRLAVEYLANPGAALLEEITTARQDLLDALRARRLQDPHQTRYLISDLGYLSGILSYAALDDGHPRAAMAHTEAAWAAAEMIGSNQMRAWIRGTQSLILRFAQRYPEALKHAQDGLRYATTGSGRARLLAGIGQCYANMEDAQGTRRALTDAEKAMDGMHGVDEMGGLFTFSRAKLYYYSGSSLIWLDDEEDATRALVQAHAAIKLWQRSGPDRSVADEALARVYAATASLQLHDLEGAEAELEPILSAPTNGQVSWIAKRMDRMTGILSAAPYATDPAARQLRERIASH